MSFAVSGPYSCYLLAYLTLALASRDAVSSSRRLHRDISLGNILLVREEESQDNIRTGYLIDWDAAGLCSEAGECVEQGRVVSRIQLNR